MSYLIPILAAIFILAYMAKRLSDKDEEEKKYDDTTQYQDKVESTIYASLHDSADKMHEHQSEEIFENNEYTNNNNCNNDINMDKESFNQEINNVPQNNDYSMSDLITDILIKIGCQPEKSDDDVIIVKFQGESFNITFGKRLARIWDLAWFGMNADDSRLPMLREAVNMSNFQSGPTIVLTTPSDENIIYVHSHYDVLLHPSYNENTDFMKAVLNSFFETKDNLYRHLNLIYSPDI